MKILGNLLLSAFITMGSINTSPFVMQDQVMSQSYTTGYGSYYYTYTTDVSTIQWQLGGLLVVGHGYQTTLTYEFNKAYTGTIEIHAVSQNVWNNVTVFTDNCYVYGKNSQDLTYTIAFTNVDNIKVSLVVSTLTATTNLSGVLFNLTSNYNLQDGVDIADVYSSIGVVDASTPPMTTSLANIYGATNDILTIAQASRTLLSQIVTALRGDNSLFNLSDVINNMYSNMVSQTTYLQSLNIPNYSQGAYRILSNNNINNINHDTYGNYVTVNSANTYSTYLYGAGAPYCMIYAIEGNNLAPVFSDNNISVNTRRTTRTNGLTVMYVEITNNTGSNGNKTFTFNTSTDRKIYPYFVGYSRQIPIDLMWACADFYNDAYTDKINQVISAINNMSVNVNNMTVNTTGIVYNVTTNEVDNSINTYNNAITYVYNVENTFANTLDDRLEQFVPTFAINTEMRENANVLGNIITSLSGNTYVSAPLTLALVGIVLLAILG